MMTIKRFFLTLTLAAAMALPAIAYEVPTHREMTRVATTKSVLFTDHSLMYSLGLLGPTEQEFLYYLRTGSVRAGTNVYSVPGLVAEGAADEDDGARALHHFFDPVNHRPLTVAGIPAGRRSWEWAVEDDPIDGLFLQQEFSLRDARDYLSKALMDSDQAQRGYAISAMFLSLGHAMHHMQDMAQPQHVRNDQHLPPFFSSRYEYYTSRRVGSLQSLMEGATPIHGPEFKTARDFWFNGSSTGIAQTVNRDFLSRGTNFLMRSDGATTSTYALPRPEGSTDYSAQSLFAAAGLPLSSHCTNPQVDCKMTMYGTTLSTRASTYSIFDQDLRATGVTVIYDKGTPVQVLTNRFFDLNRFNFDDIYDWVIPRAVSYSAGIVNHFFRGRLKVTAPAVGAYSVVDHSTNEGFRRVRLTAKNITPGEALPSGTIRLIAKYHRNPCYKPDLTGEFRRDGAGNLVAPCTNWRTPEQFVSVSLPQDVSFDVDQEKQFSFLFLDPIPLNATDLMLYVYYTGWVGSEEKSFALGAVDVSEPTYMAMMNATDVFLLHGAFHYWRTIVEKIAEAPYSAADVDENGIYNTPPDVNVVGGNMTFESYVNGMKVADAAGVPEGRFARLAMLVDLTGYDHGIVGRSHLFVRGGTSHFPPKILQGNVATPVSPLRNDTLQYMSTTMNAYHPFPITDISSMPKSLMPDSTIPFPLQMTPGVGALVLAPTDGWSTSLTAFRAMQASALAPIFRKPEPKFFAQPLRPAPGAPAAAAPRGPAAEITIEAQPK